MIPGHVPAELVRDFDFYRLQDACGDIHAFLAEMQQCFPRIFWTPHNGGHWVATGGRDVIDILRDPARFSSNVASLPPASAEIPRVIPVEIDPPRHGFYRRPLVAGLHPARVAELDAHVRRVAIETIDLLRPVGECEFINDFAKVLPIHVFLKLVDLPLSDKDYLLKLADDGIHGGDVEARNAGMAAMVTYLRPFVRARRAIPGSDLLSQIVAIDIDGAMISEEEAINYSMLLLFGGLDTVAAMLGFIAYYLANHGPQRRELVANLGNAGFMKSAVEELLRRHGISNMCRVVVGDLDYAGVALRGGDFILPLNSCVGLDEELNPDPLTVDFHRSKPLMAVFGAGAHACPGASLARREVRIFLEEWLARIPDFRIAPGTTPRFVSGLTNAVRHLDLCWS